jgi:hypothetical protein
MKYLPRVPTDKMLNRVANVIKTRPQNMYINWDEAQEVYQAMYDAAPCPWTKIGGKGSLPPDGIYVHVIAHGKIKKNMMFIRKTSLGDIKWFCDDVTSFYYGCPWNSPIAPTHFYIPVIQELPEELT